MTVDEIIGKMRKVASMEQLKVEYKFDQGKMRKEASKALE